MTLLAVVSSLDRQNGQNVGAATSGFTGSATDLAAHSFLMFGIQ